MTMDQSPKGVFLDNYNYLNREKMDLTKLKELIGNKNFQSTQNECRYRFIAGTTLQVNGRLANSVQYELLEENDNYILHHNCLFGTEPLIMRLTDQMPVSLILYRKHSGEIMDTWIEIEE